jgi:Dolichyl-phosphate-mannose-protein mannosyltransferase
MSISTLENPCASSSSAQAERMWGVAALALIALLTVCYFALAARDAATSPYWMDEVLSVWTARQPSDTAVIDALLKGSEFSPPLYDLLLHNIIALGGSQPLALRLPSIVAVYLIGVAAFILVRRRYSLHIAATAMALCLVGGLYPFALQVRPYACAAACFAFALVIWDGARDRPPSWRNAAAMAALLAVAIGLHFYSLLFAATLGAMELAWTASHRRLRWLYLGAIALALLSVLLWLPFIHTAIAFNHGDVGAADYYARPDAAKLPKFFVFLGIGHSSLLSPFLAFVLAYLAARIPSWRDKAKPIAGEMESLNIAVTALCAFPLIVFFFALIVTHALSFRYMIVAALGFSILTAQWIARLSHAPQISCSVIAIAIGICFSPVSTEMQAKPPGPALKIVDAAPPDLPIVTGNGLRYFELREGAAPSVSQRLVYLKPVAGTVLSDPTNEHQVERWEKIALEITAADIRSFVNSHPAFLLFKDESGADILPRWLKRCGYRLEPVARSGETVLLKVVSPYDPLRPD